MYLEHSLLQKEIMDSLNKREACTVIDVWFMQVSYVHDFFVTYHNNSLTTMFDLKQGISSLAAARI